MSAGVSVNVDAISLLANLKLGTTSHHFHGNYEVAPSTSLYGTESALPQEMIVIFKARLSQAPCAARNEWRTYVHVIRRDDPWLKLELFRY